MARVRLAGPEDGPAIADIYGPYVRETPISFEESAPSAQEMASRIEKTLDAYPFLVCEEQNTVVAYAYASRHAERPAYRWSCNVAVYVAPELHRLGFGRMLYSRLFEVLARQRFHVAFAGITLPNAKSVGLHEAMGFELVGVYREVGFKAGAWRDVGWWRRSIDEGLPAGEPILFSAIRGG